MLSDKTNRLCARLMQTACAIVIVMALAVIGNLVIGIPHFLNVLMISGMLAVICAFSMLIVLAADLGAD